MGSSAPSVAFNFDYYRFNGRGNPPTLVPSLQQANFIRSRQSIDGSLVNAAIDRIHGWSERNGISVTLKEPYPSSQAGKFWLEFRIGGLTL